MDEKGGGCRTELGEVLLPFTRRDGDVQVGRLITHRDTQTLRKEDGAIYYV